MKKMNITLIVLIVITFPSSYANPQDMTKIYHIKCLDSYITPVFVISNATITDFNLTSDKQINLTIQNSKNGHLTAYIPQNFQVPTEPHSPIEFTVNNTFLVKTDTSNSTHYIHSIDLPDGNMELKLEVIKVLARTL